MQGKRFFIIWLPEYFFKSNYSLIVAIGMLKPYLCNMRRVFSCHTLFECNFRRRDLDPKNPPDFLDATEALLSPPEWPLCFPKNC